MPQVLLVSTARGFRGGEVQALLLLRGLKERGIPCLLAAPPGEPLAAQAARAGLEVAPLPRRSEASPANFFALRRLLASFRPDLVHLSDAHAAACALWLRLVPRRPRIVAHRHLPYPVRYKWKYSALPDAVIAVSRTVAESLTRRGVPQGKISIIYAALDPFFLTAGPETRVARQGLGWPAEAPVFLYGAALTRQKWHHLLLRAFSEVSRAEPEAVLALAGAGPLEQELREQAPSGVLFLGNLDQRRMREAYRAADVLVFPGGEEGYPVASLEAQACGLPVVAVNRGGVAETVRHGETGLLVAPEPGALAAAMLELVRSPEKRRKLGEAARSLAAGQFSPDAMVEQTLALYRSLLGEARRASQPGRPAL